MPHSPFAFVVGCGRSGTTLLRTMLDSHRHLAIPFESHFIPSFTQRYARRFDVDEFALRLQQHPFVSKWDAPLAHLPGVLHDVAPRTFPDAVRSLYAWYAQVHGKTRYGDKTPGYVGRITLLAGLFPEARFVHIIRDGRDVALSYLDIDFGPRTIPEAAAHWRGHIRQARDAAKTLEPGRYTEIRYEALVDRPRDILTAVCAFLDLPFDEGMLSYPDRAGDFIPAEHARYHKHLGREPTPSLRDWRTQMSPDERAAFLDVAGELLDELGYER